MFNWLPPSAALAHFEPAEGMHVASGEETTPAQQVRYGFRVGMLGLLIDANTESEILKMPQVTPLPGAQAGFLGLINLRGNLVPIYELRILLHLEPRKPGANPLALIFGKGENAVGVLTEEFPVALHTLRPLPSLPVLPNALQEHVHYGYIQDELVWLEFDHGSFFDVVSRGITLEPI